MDCLPLELLHTVCRHLPTADVGDFRLVSKTFAVVGIQYLLPEVHVMFHSHSLARIEAISKHPVLRQYVTSIFYEGDTLNFYKTPRSWSRDTVPPHVREWYLADRHSAGSYVEKYAYTRGLGRIERAPRAPFSKDESIQGWQHYRVLMSDQSQLHLRQWEQILPSSLKRFPRLKSFTHSTGTHLRRRTPTMHRLYDPSLLRPDGDLGHFALCGYGTLNRLLVAAGHCCDSKFETLKAGWVLWQFFLVSRELFEVMKRGVKHLKVLSLSISTHRRDEVDGVHEVIDASFGCLKESGKMLEFLTSAPHLRELEVRFKMDSRGHRCPADLAHIVGDFTWPMLTSVCFDSIRTNEKSLLAFFQRHAAKLREVKLRYIFLTSGTWRSIFEGMRQILSLQKFDTINDLNGVGEVWKLSSALSKALERYLIDGGQECPLLDDAFAECRRITD